MATHYSHEDLNYSIRSSGSNSVRLSDLDIFSPIAVQDEIEQCSWERVYPQDGSLDDSQPG